MNSSFPLSLRQMLLTVLVVAISGVMFALAFHWFEHRELSKIQGNLMETQAVLAAASISPELLKQQDPKDQKALTGYVQEALAAEQKGEFEVIIFGNSGGNSGLLPLAGASTPAVIAEVQASLAVQEAFLGEVSNAVAREGSGEGTFFQKLAENLGFGGRNRIIISAAPVRSPLSQVQGGVVAIRQKQGPSAVALNSFAKKAGIGLLAGLIPAILVGGVFASRLGKEVRKMMDGVDQIRLGRYEFRINNRRTDEIGKTQDGINQLAEALEAEKGKNEEAMREIMASQKEAEVAAEAKSDFLANMSHEIRTPMNGITGTTSLLMETEMSHQQRELLQIIRSSGQSLLHIINDVLDYSKLESAKMTLDETPTQLRLLIEEVGDMFAFNCAGKNIELMYFVDPTVPMAIYSDRERLKQILVNLIGNAVKFTEGGEIVMQALVVTGDDNNPRIQYSVRDSGIGIEEAQLENIFQAFQQADVSTTRKFGGSGLGLAISRKLCRLMGGDIRVESQPGEGSTFFFELPFRLVPEQPESAEPERRKQLIQGRTAAILTKQPNVGELARMHLNNWGMEAHVVEGVDAQTMDQLNQIRPSGLLIDSTGQDRDTLREFVHQMTAHSVPTVLMTRLGEDPVVELSASNPILQSVSKPLKEEEFLFGLADAFSGGQLSTEKTQQRAEADLAPTFAMQYPGKILLVEDQPMNQKIVGMMLQKIGYSVDIANNGREGADYVKERQEYDIIFMDLQMPVMGGVDCAKEIRGNFRLPKQPIIIAMTGHALTGVRESCKAAGMDEFMTKPVSIDDLRGAIERTYGRLQAAA